VPSVVLDLEDFGFTVVLPGVLANDRKPTDPFGVASFGSCMC